VLAYDCTSRDGATATAVLMHPHPEMGGNRFHPVVETLHRGLPVNTLRFDFTSANVGVAQADVVEAIDLAPEGPIVLIGYSFGADIALTVTHPRVVGWFAVAPPLRVVDPGQMGAGADARPKLLAVPERDQYSSPARAAELTAGWVATSIVPIAGADHFLAGHERAVLQPALGWLPSVLPPG
jgi:alpha/beta superfamily hydrolase